MLSTILHMILPGRLKTKYLSWRQKELMKTFHKNPIKLAIKEYKQVFGHAPNLNHPENLIEKIIWMQFNCDTSLWTQCADKYRVREFVEQRGLGDILCKLYGVWKDANDIDFETLPNKFVLKTNNSCGQIIIVKDKAKLDFEAARKQLNNWMSEGYGFSNAQMHYTRIKPRIIAEELLEVPEGQCLNDYKIWSFNGSSECILVCSDRIPGKGIYELSMYDTNWNNISSYALNHNSMHFNGNEVSMPDNLSCMIEIAQKLSVGFPEVRVDLYNINGRIIFGELTFTTGYGSYSKPFYQYLGTKVILPNNCK